ncbi:MAG: Rrf2 family transcriptional regulator [Spirochaetes bacterium]|nr:Rrf2 family transcriptional regulator [Spirochaetota bacterium]
MRITTKGRYALRAVANLAASHSDKPVSIKQIAEEEDISPEFLEQIFFKLKKAGIIRSVRGPGGGFILAKDPNEITIQDIFIAVGEGVKLTPCSNCSKTEKEKDVGCSRIDICPIHGVWVEVSKGVSDILTSYTLEKIIDRKLISN